MKYYNSVGPNPKVVRMFMAESGLSLETIEVDLMGGENRQAAYMEKNPTGTCPCLELDDGSILSEITAICEYLDEKNGQSSLIGETPEERAQTRMWSRRIDLGILENMANGFRYSEGLPLFKDRIYTIPHAADDLKAITREKIAWLDALMSGNEFVCGDRFSLADILLFCFLEFGQQVGQPFESSNKHIASWFERIKSRPSAVA